MKGPFPPRDCADHARPFLIECGYDAAELLLRHLYPEGDLKGPADPHEAGRLHAFDQTDFFQASSTASLSGVGYRVENRTRLIDEESAAHVRPIFARLLKIGSCTELAREVGARGIRTPRGNRIDKKYFSRMLKIRACIGEAVHKGESCPGEHAAIIDRET